MPGLKSTRNAAARRANPPCLSDSIREAMDRYFRDLDGQDPGELYDLVLSQVELPLFEIVMRTTNGNISRASQLLGLNRGTLRNRLKKYGLDK